MAAKAFFLFLTAFLSCSILAASRSLGHSRSLLQAAAPATPVVGVAPATPPAGAPPITPGAGGAPAATPVTGGPTVATPAGGPIAPTSVTPVISGGVAVYDVTTFGAKADNKTDNVMAFMHAWIAACKNSTTPSKVLIPAGAFVAGPTVFAGPCTSPKPITVEVLGTVVATVDPSEYVSPEWFTFEHVDGLVITGNGVFDGQGGVFWQYNDCKGKSSECASLPSSLKFNAVSNVIVNGISSVNSKQFHFHLHESSNFTASYLTITAPGNSPNTDGMHIGSSSLVTVSHSVIGTGDDCISVGEGSSNVTIFNITCGPGHGISVGSLGKRPDDKSVNGVSITNCTFKGTTNGARIKTMVGQSPGGEAKSILYQDLLMDNVSNPVVIDQSYGTKAMRFQSKSFWKISDVHFKNIKGSTTTNAAVSLDCSITNPCEGVEVADIDLTFTPLHANKSFFSACSNAKATFTGTLNPPACSSTATPAANVAHATSPAGAPTATPVAGATPPTAPVGATPATPAAGAATTAAPPATPIVDAAPAAPVAGGPPATPVASS
ncbi:exopolygalacturonase clone GBGE184-like [Neltuma alba]|uniref:exopolygalacturonase clone GBGE184-like n=1 Tax=Neltuma alba TaxID=207710 RepID=UPI0010A3B244|nr:exopolygalacturonase clone GBGE184-like [Prosopis alba]